MLILIVKSFGSTNKGAEEYINYKITYSHSKLVKFTIIMNKWTVLKLLQN
jgi:hypothetical protein